MASILLFTAPFTQLNTPYPATAYIKGFLNTLQINTFQADLGLEVILNIFSADGLSKIFEQSENNTKIEDLDSNSQRIFALRNQYCQIIEPVISFLQGNNPTLARQMAMDGFLPKASRFEHLDDLEWAFGTMGLHDQAKYLATLFLEDIADFIVATVDPFFGFSRYAERLGRSANSFDELHEKLNQKPTFIDEITLRILSDYLNFHQPELVCFSVPFPGNLYSTFRCAKFIKQHFPATKIAIGGGFPNTELRSISDARVFEFVDFITLDDGELPLELLIENIKNPNLNEWKRTFRLVDGVVVYENNTSKPDYKQLYVGTPDYGDLRLHEYLAVIEVANPMHSLWSDGRWNKLTMAHGCYWGKCTFCDISLDYIKLYEPIAAKVLVDRMEALILQTGETGFHFVDEAAPPALMRELALEIIKRKLIVTWWTNIRFEKSFTEDLCFLLKASGCIAVSGGLEVASDRLLALIDKGVTVEQVAKVTKNLTASGIMVHAYLMYGYPTQTIQETIDSLEMVRQMFKSGILQSGFWHQFAMTAHSPVGLRPEEFGVIPIKKTITFAHNDVEFTDKTGINHDKFSFGLKKSLFNFMHGIGLDFPLSNWFDFKIPNTKINTNFIEQALQNQSLSLPKPNRKVVWLGNNPQIKHIQKSKKGQTWQQIEMTFHHKTGQLTVLFNEEEGNWLSNNLSKWHFSNPKIFSLGQIQADFEENLPHFELFWTSKSLQKIQSIGLLTL
uniref:B12-binding domain-containing radical SAM protein n=1 Tax=Flavobacterium sp. TaxID=239 RepID=UPI00404B1138